MIKIEKEDIIKALTDDSEKWQEMMDNLGHWLFEDNPALFTEKVMTPL